MAKIIKEYQCDNEQDFAMCQEDLFGNGLEWWISGQRTIKCPYDKFPVYVQVWDDDYLTYCSTPDEATAIS